MFRSHLRFVAGVVFLRRAPLAFALGLTAGVLRAQPSGGEVVAGTAAFSAGPGTLTITQTSPRAIINWQEFSLASGQTARFIQPDAASATLNRVISGAPSTLLGRLEANGTVFLINPNGILIGTTARIDAGGFLASTLDVSNQEFLAGGDLHFSGNSTAAVQNLGAINALGGDVFLIARQVENSGTIAASNGTVALGAGSEILLTTGGEERLFVHAGSSPGTIANGGAIAAVTAELKAAGGNAYALAIASTGLVRATGSAVREARIWLVASDGGSVASSGTLAARNEDGSRGGEVRVLGGTVTLNSGALVDVSGEQGGGTALIGGDWQGKNPAVPNAQTTTVAPGAWLRADAGTSGSGGKIVVWADGATRFAGAISARGGAMRGDGGAVEVSGKASLDFRGTVDLTATTGQTGGLLLDPTNLTIGGTADVNGDLTTGDDATGNIAAGDNPGVDSFITAGAVTTLLGTTSLSLAATNNITVNNALAWNSAFGLTLDAGNALAINAAVTNSGIGAVTLIAGGAVTLGANVSGGGQVILNHGGALTQTAGTVSASSQLLLNGLGAVGTSGTPLATSAALITLNKGAGAGATFVQHPTTVSFRGTTGGALTLDANSGINIYTSLTTGGATAFNADKNNDGTGTFTVDDFGSVTTNNSTLNVTAADVNLAVNNALNSGTAATSITASFDRTIGLGATAGNLTLSNLELSRITSGSLSLNTTTQAGDVTVNGINFVGSLNTGTVTINAGGTVTFATGASTFQKGIVANANDGVAESVDLTATNGNIALDGDADSSASPGDGIVFTGTPTLTAGIDYVTPHDPTMGSITLRNGTSGANGNIASGALNLRAADNITLSDDLTATAGTFSAIANNPSGADGLNSVNGLFTLASGKTIATATSGNIEIMASGLDLAGSLNGVGTVNLSGSRNMSVSLGAVVPAGTAPFQVNISDAELGRITATDLTVGVESTGLGTIYVQDVTAANTDQFGTLTLTTPGPIHFEGASVVGNRLTANGAGGIVFIALANVSTSTAGTPDPDFSLSGNNIAFNNTVTATAGGTGTLSLTTTGALTSHGNLTLESGDDLALNYALSVPGLLTLNADKNNDGTGTFTVANAVTVATTGAAHPIDLTAADVVLTGTGALNAGVSPVSITASANRSIGLGATNVAGGLNIVGAELQQITATGLTLTSAGDITVDGISEANSNNIAGVTTLTANGGTSAVSFANGASTFNALTVNSTTTIANNATLTLDVGNLVLNAGGDISQTGAIEIGAGTANLTGDVITLAHADNTLGAITVNSGAGDVSIREDDAVSIAGIARTSGNLTLNAATDITQTGVITIATGSANLTGSNITLGSANVLGAVTINAGTGNIALTEADAIAIAGITHTGTLNLTASGAITDSGALVVSGTTTLAAGATNDITLDNANDFSTVVVTSGKDVTLNDINALAFGNVTAAGSLLATAAGHLTLNAGATIAASGAGANPLVLVAGGNFINNSGSTALDAGTGRWLVYSTSPAGSTENGLTAVAGSTLPRLYNKTFAGNAPATIAAGNHLIYSAQPTLTVTADDKTRAYGAANAFTATITGFLSDDGVTDTTTTAGITGTAGLTSAATATSPVSGSPFTIVSAIGTLASGAGYDFSFVNGNLTITKADLTLTGTRVYDGTTFFAGADLTAAGVNGESFAVTGAGASGNLTTKNIQTAQLLNSVTGLGLGAGNSGAALAANYNDLSVTGSSVSVTAAPLTISTSNVVKTYDGGTSATGTPVVTSGTLFGSDVLVEAGLGASYAFVGKDVGVGNKTVTVAGVGVNDGNNGNNYAITLASNTTSTINQADLTLSGTRVYDGTTLFAGANLTATGVNGETFAVTGVGAAGNLATRNVQTGQALATLTGLALGAGNSGAAVSTNYHALSVTGSAVNVTAASVTASTSNVIKTYDGGTSATGSPVVTAGALFGGDTLTGGTFAFTDKNVGSGNKTVTVSGVTVSDGNGGNNYTATQADNTTSTINAATLTYVATSASRLVGDADPAFTGTVTGFVGGETQGTATTGTLAFATTATNASPIGTYPIDGSGLLANNGNYVFVQAAGNATAFTINDVTPPAPPQVTLTITADDKSKIYGAALPDFTATFAGFINGHTATNVTGLQFSTTATIGSNVGTFAIVPFGASAPSDYTVAYVPGTLTINPATLTYVATPATRVFGANDPAFAGSVTGFVNGDTPTSATTGTLVFATTATSTSAVGAYPLDGSGLAANHGNYVFVQAAGNATAFTITPLAPPPQTALTITADDKTKIYGAALPAFTATFAGFKNGDTSAMVTGLQFSTTATMGSNVGTYVITPFGATAPATYLIDYVTGTLTINPASLSITASDVTRLYGAANPAFGASFAGFVNGDTATVVTGLQLATSATPASGVGRYSITPSNASAHNYALTFVPGTLTIDPAQLTIAANSVDRLFGQDTPSFSASITGLVNGDTTAVVTGLRFSTTPTDSASDFTIVPGGASATNYGIDYVNGRLHVVTPTVAGGDGELPVTIIDGEPVQTSDFAVVEQDGRLTLVPVDQNNDAPAPDKRLELTLGDASDLPALAEGSAAQGLPFGRGSTELIFGGFEPVGDVGGGADAARANTAGLFRETSVSAGGFNIIYHEALTDEPAQSRDNAAIGSSYREFSDSENPQINLVRSKVERKSGESANPSDRL